MTVFQSISQDAGSIDKSSNLGIELLRKLGVVLPASFQCIGMPWVCFEDFTRDEGQEFDFEFFKGRIVLGGNMNSSEFSWAPGGPAHFTLCRMSLHPGDAGRVTVGTTDLTNTSIVSQISVTIGDNVRLDPRVIIQDNDGHPSDRRLPDIVENKKRAPVVIEDEVWIGYGSTILKGVTIGHHAVVQPGSVVMWDVAPRSVVAGNPAKNITVFRKYLQGGIPRSEG